MRDIARRANFFRLQRENIQLENEQSKAMQELSPRLTPWQFVNKIIRDAQTGWSFVPLIGSGLSSPSGIIMGMEFTNYLAFATYLVLSDPSQRRKTYGEGYPQRWDLVRKGWPPFPSSEEVNASREWIKVEFAKLCNRLELEINYDDRVSGGSPLIKSVTPKRFSAAAMNPGLGFSYPHIPQILKAADAADRDNYSSRLIDFLARETVKEKYVAAFAIDEMVPDANRSYRSRIIEMGVRSLHDWRETLVFLSMAGIDPHDNQKLIWNKRDSSIIDAFNSFITRDKQPNLGHKILAHLSSPLRIQTILTTNFDTLMEDAFKNLSLSLRVLPVSAKGRLPEVRTVAADDCLVKLHGEAQDTRADLSLDEEPSEEDKRMFSAYLTRGAGNLGNWTVDDKPKFSFQSKRLLIVGYSGADHRCVQMIRSWLEKTKDAAMYWICFSDGDVKRVNALFADPIYRNKVRITQTSRPDLLLYELYQRLVLSLPPGGLTYEFSHIVPPRRQKSFDYLETEVENARDCGKEANDAMDASRVLIGDSGDEVMAKRLARDSIVLQLRKTIVDAIKGNTKFYRPDGEPIESNRDSDPFVNTQMWLPRYRIPDLKRDIEKNEAKRYADYAFKPVLLESLGGMVRASALAVDDLAREGFRVFWMETQDYMDADALLRDFLRGLALRYGTFQSRHVTVHPLSKSIIQESSELSTGFEATSRTIAKHLKHVLVEYRADPKKIAVILYGRDSFGSCSGMLPSHWPSVDDSDQSVSRSIGTDSPLAAFQAFHCLIESFARAGIPTVYFPLSKERAASKSRSVIQWQVHTKSTDPVSGKSMSQQRQNVIDSPTEVLDDDFLDTDSNWKKFLLKLGNGNKGYPNESAKSIAEWSHDPFYNSAIHPSISVFHSIITKVLAQFFTYDLGASNVLRPRYERLSEDRQLTFLYALTLFRHSRHPNAVCSEAVFQCPYRHNANAVDNDYVRSVESAAWISELRKSRVFFDKPGGSVWMHRDVRLALQRILESSPLGRKGDGRRRNHHFSEVRARLHFWIGDWYFKAFCSSGHLTPIIEAMHHRIMAAVFAPFAKPQRRAGESHDMENLTNYQSMLFESAILEACKTLLVAWNSLMLWQASPFEATWISVTHWKKVAEQLIAAIELIVSAGQTRFPKSKTIAARLTKRVNQLLELVNSLRNHLTIEGGCPRKERTPDLDPRSISIQGLQDFFKKEEGESTSLHQVDHSLSAISGADETFLKTIRSYFKDDLLGEFASKIIACLLDVSKRTSGSGDQKYGSSEALRTKAQAIQKLSETKARWKQFNAEDPFKLHHMIWTLGETAYVLLRRSKLEFHAFGAVKMEHWLTLTAACNLGIDLCKHLPPFLLDFEVQSKIKLHALYAVGLANLGRFFESNRHLNEAQALLSKSHEQSKTEFAILNLRRAEVRLTKCFWINLFLDKDLDRWPSPLRGRSQRDPLPDTTSVEGWPGVTSSQIQQVFGCDGFVIAKHDNLDHGSLFAVQHVLEQSQNGHALLIPPRIAVCLRKAKTLGEWRKLLLQLYAASLDEAVALLDQGERMLIGESQSSLWWSRLHTLRLRAYGMLAPLGADASSSLSLRKYSPDMGIYDHFTNAFRIATNDGFRKLRAIKYFLLADRWLSDFAEVMAGQDRVTRKTKNLLPDSHAAAIDSLYALFVENVVKDSRVGALVREWLKRKIAEQDQMKTMGNSSNDPDAEIKALGMLKEKRDSHPFAAVILQTIGSFGLTSSFLDRLRNDPSDLLSENHNELDRGKVAAVDAAVNSMNGLNAMNGRVSSRKLRSKKKSAKKKSAKKKSAKKSVKKWSANNRISKGPSSASRKRTPSSR